MKMTKEQVRNPEYRSREIIQSGERERERDSNINWTYGNILKKYKTMSQEKYQEKNSQTID